MAVAHTLSMCSSPCTLLGQTPLPCMASPQPGSCCSATFPNNSHSTTGYDEQRLSEFTVLACMVKQEKEDHSNSGPLLYHRVSSTKPLTPTVTVPISLLTCMLASRRHVRPVNLEVLHTCIQPACKPPPDLLAIMGKGRQH